MVTNSSDPGGGGFMVMGSYPKGKAEQFWYTGGREVKGLGLLFQPQCYVARPAASRDGWSPGHRSESQNHRIF